MASLVWVLGAVALATAGVGSPPVGWEERFAERTLRVDLFHTGHSNEEVFALDRLVVEGVWAGPRGQGLVDLRPQGRYLARLVDAGSGETLWARPWDSYFGEYRTTAAAQQGRRRTFHESLRLPLPRRPAELSIAVRDGKGLRELWRAAVDPGDIFLAQEGPPAGVLVVDGHPCAPAAACLDLAIVGEGYTSADAGKFRADVARFSAVLLRQQPFARLSARLAVRGVLVPSPQRGCDEPSRGVWRRTALGASFDALGSERYLLTEDNRALREAAAAVPYDLAIIMVHHKRYGGGGIFNFYSTFTSDNQWSEYVFLHELGHALAGLADEYYTSAVAYNDFFPPGVEPAEPNITALLDPGALKWRALVRPSTPLPTPWEKAGFDELDRGFQKRREELSERIAAAMRGGAERRTVQALLEESERLSTEHARAVDAYLSRSAWRGVVGAFAGAGYAAEGLFRPALDCIMFSKGVKPFCPVCQEAIAHAIDLLTDARGGVNQRATGAVEREGRSRVESGRLARRGGSP